MKQLLLGLALAAAACSHATVPPPDRSEIEEAEKNAEKVGTGDVIEIKVFREPDLAGIYRVGRDGNIDFPLIGKVSTKGKDAETVAADIRARLADGFLKNPQVTVFVREQRSQKVHVTGFVKNPGSFPYEAGMTVIQAITAAGGFTQLASTNGVKVTRAEVEEPYKIPVDSIRRGESPNFLLQPGDIVYVPEAIF